MKKQILSIVLCLCMICTVFEGTVFAADISGTITSDTVWNDGDVINGAVTISGGTAEAPVVITVHGTVTMSNEVTISDGYVKFTGGGTLIRSDENNSYSFLRIKYGNVILEDITLDGANVEFTNRDGNYTGVNSAVVVESGSLTLNDGAIIQNNIKRSNIGSYENGGGAAIYVAVNGITANVVMNGGSLRNNTSHRRGGAVFLGYAGHMTLNGGEITGNKTEPNNSGTAQYAGGGVYIHEGSFTMTGGSITNNSATLGGDGGGIYNTSYGTLIITGGTISGNTADDIGNGIYHSSRYDTASVLKIGGAANIEDEIYLSNTQSAKDAKVISALKNNVKFTVENAVDGRIIGEGVDYDLTYADMAKMNVTNSDLMLRLENNQISLSSTADIHSVYFAYDANGGSENVPASEEISVTPGSEAPTRTVDFTVIPTREGYTFLGWDTDKNAAVPAYTQESGEQTITITENTTLYAVWEAVPSEVYTITAIASEGGTVSGGGEVEEGGSITLTAAPNKNYKFDGWYDGETKVCETAEFVVENVTADKTYTAKFAYNPVSVSESKLFSTNHRDNLLIRAKNTELTSTLRAIKGVSFVDLSSYDLTGITTVDYSADGDESVLAWFDNATAVLYIGGYGKIVAGSSLNSAFKEGECIEAINGLNMLDTSNVTDMSKMFYMCGYSSEAFTLDLGDNFDTSNVTDMSYMFYRCGYHSRAFTLDLGDNFDTSNVTTMYEMFNSCGNYSTVFTLDLGNKFDTSNVTTMFRMFDNCGRRDKAFTLNLGDKFDTSNVTDMYGMFSYCGGDSKAFTRLDLSGFTVSPNTILKCFAAYTPVTEFVFGEGWANAKMPETGMTFGAFYVSSNTPIKVTGATPNLLSYDWAEDNRTVTFTGKSYYTVTAEASEGGAVSGGGKVIEGGSVTLTASANEGYTFDGWYDGETKVCDTAEFAVENVTMDKTYTAKFVADSVIDPDPSAFDFTSLRTLKTQSVAVNHETKTIEINAETDADYITIYVYQLDAIPGGTFRMASYMGNKVVYNSAGSYRIYFISNPTVTVKANITIGDQTEQYTVNINFDMTKASFDFTNLRGENINSVAVDHDAKAIKVQAADDVDSIILYVSQHDAIYGGTLRMASYLGNKVTYASNGVYTVYSNGKENVSVKTNITINGVTEQYMINITFPVTAPTFSFNTLAGVGMESVAIDHDAGTIVINADNANTITLPIEQDEAFHGKLRMVSYLGNKVSFDQNTRVYTISRRDKSTIQVKVKVELGSDSKEYLMTINYMDMEWGFDTVNATNVSQVSVDHATQTVTMDVTEGFDHIVLYIDQECAAGASQIWMKSYMGNDVVYNTDDRTYTITRKDKDDITVAAKITILGETRYYNININFSSAE